MKVFQRPKIKLIDIMKTDKERKKYEIKLNTSIYILYSFFSCSSEYS